MEEDAAQNGEAKALEHLKEAKEAYNMIINDKEGRVKAVDVFGKYATEKKTPQWSYGDIISIIFIIIPLFIPYAVFTLIYEILIFFPTLIGYSYIVCFVKKPCNRLEGFGFQLLCLILLPIAAPAIIVLWLWVFLVWFYSFFVSMPFGLFRIIFLCQGPVIYNNFRLIWKQCVVTPFYIWPDVCRAWLGCAYRQGIIEYMSPQKFLQGGAGAYLLSALLKYSMIVNPWLYTLEIQFCNQWSPPLQGDVDEVTKALLDYISQAIPLSDDRKVIDNGRFAPHYPYPPPSRRSVIGSQFGEHLKYPTFTKSTHKLDLSEIPEERRENMERNLFFVELSYTNPFHFLTGDVYFGRRTDLTWEHPMYCVQPQVGYVATYFYSSVNELFRAYVPTDVSLWVEVRAEGQQIAEKIV